MPLVAHSSYRSPPFLPGGHLQTIVPNQLRRVGGVRYSRERIATPDGDFLDLDWSAAGRAKLAIVSHGLEGHSQRPYVLGMVRALNRGGWDALAWNFRGCSGQPNRRLRFYHSGATDDLQTVIAHALKRRQVAQCTLIGFSLGGNMTLKYLGERRGDVPRQLTSAVTFSVPCDLRAGAQRMAQPQNRLYMRRFMCQLRRKIVAKAERMPGQLDIEGIGDIVDFRGFDDRYTAPLHGFKDAEEYWARNSCRRYLKDVKIPALIVNAHNDPFLDGGCYPVAESAGHPQVHLEMPLAGGHVGFPAAGGRYWSEERALGFMESSSLRE